jgi:hypothetical protein
MVRHGRAPCRAPPGRRQTTLTAPVPTRDSDGRNAPAHLSIFRGCVCSLERTRLALWSALSKHWHSDSRFTLAGVSGWWLSPPVVVTYDTVAALPLTAPKTSRSPFQSARAPAPQPVYRVGANHVLTPPSPPTLFVPCSDFSVLNPPFPPNPEPFVLQSFPTHPEPFTIMFPPHPEPLSGHLPFFHCASHHV